MIDACSFKELGTCGDTEIGHETATASVSMIVRVGVDGSPIEFEAGGYTQSCVEKSGGESAASGKQFDS
jgi:hypothetical protein